ncbi:MAG: ribosome silencing factor [Bacteroidetes bacterium]|jgi:ribosome-associated protein|nr:ribosome silencing factor [Cryomorphaceae bacterium]MBL6677205.1 ribosome silencing factor [Flavobacteriaceae bacterium]MDA0330534.1 ribosome silencing factor [Bacteroidota bacterium]MDA0885006.1 ribosome silencing factor [Bacteroidota bacterium]MDA1225443.1 ribosome silencing factor [Bacteroidota bacterium]
MVKSKSSDSELITKIIFGIEDVKGVDVCIMDLTDIANTVCGYFIICTGTSNTHVSAIVSSIRKHVSKQLKEKPFSVEGNENQEWVLIDYVNIVVHVFQREIREYYDIENLWGDAKIKNVELSA